ncbi:hypothetical protein Tsubulata_000877 [Turnera subulata]|uniref:BZIP domain-containing protein n=1 Tax=Turnera subulata TaxID=218843 RepID=A0A9Q0JJR9_9ROSI|nr:hypothetical protein Tsubulata_000877 [Turnera subulata]
MLSAISPSNPLAVTRSPFHSFENGFTPWDCCFETSPDDDQSPKPAGSGSTSGSDGPNRSGWNPANSNSGSEEPNPLASPIDERKQRRMISNRESARRSRMRKQKHLENLRNQVNRLRVENRDLSNRLRLVLYHCHAVRTDNDRLRSEHTILRKKLSDIRQILMIRQLQQFTSAWPCNNINMSEQIPSLITS